METQYDAHVLPVYLRYERLTAKTLGHLLNELGGIADFAAETYSRHCLIRVPLPMLEVETVRTGDSIKITFGEGWLPTVSTDKDNDIVINTPKKLGIPLLVGYLLLGAAEKTMNLHNEYLDGQLKRIELKLKEQELGKAMKPDSELVPELMPQATNTVKALVHNGDITVFQVYDIDIISRPDDRRKRHHRQ
jgi:hypothetical protein